ncbi:hypothetical protein [Streptomyces sp. NPDC050534]|uniref:hypothetical protein n=1 Tax=Streptomyces sp. NPDC050534 TaxID=3365625 RepID=UPI0037AB02A1
MVITESMTRIRLTNTARSAIGSFKNASRVAEESFAFDSAAAAFSNLSATSAPSPPDRSAAIAEPGRACCVVTSVSQGPSASPGTWVSIQDWMVRHTSSSLSPSVRAVFKWCFTCSRSTAVPSSSQATVGPLLLPPQEFQQSPLRLKQVAQGGGGSLMNGGRHASVSRRVGHGVHRATPICEQQFYYWDC